MDARTLPAGSGRAAVRPGRHAASWPARLVRALTRTTVTLHAAATFVQPVLAGRIVMGDFDVVVTHAAVGGVLFLLGMVEAVMAAVLWRLDRRPGWGALLAALLVVAEIAQLAAGSTGFLALHVPLGVAIAVASALLLVWAWRRAPAPTFKEYS